MSRIPIVNRTAAPAPLRSPEIRIVSHVSGWFTGKTTAEMGPVAMVMMPTTSTVEPSAMPIACSAGTPGQARPNPTHVAAVSEATTPSASPRGSRPPPDGTLGLAVTTSARPASESTSAATLITPSDSVPETRPYRASSTGYV